MFSRFYFILNFFLVLFIHIYKSQDYSDIRKKYESLTENDEHALKYVNQYILKAKNSNDYERLFRGYQDGVYYSSDKEKKLKYSDSCIFAAKLTKNNDIISSSFLLKGSLYYFCYKKYKVALDEYLKAYNYSKNSNDLFLKYKLLYQLGLMKSYLGYYKEALNHFEDCINFFEQKIKETHHPNDMYNFNKGYLNSIHQSIVCYRNLNDYKKVDSLIRIGLQNTENKKDFVLERNYFLKCKGIAEYHYKNYIKSTNLLLTSIPIIKKSGDFGWSSVGYYYIGKNYISLNEKQKAIIYFKKVDSIFQKHQFILPELRDNYEQLIKYYKNNNPKEELYYTKTLLKADSIINKDFTYLSSRIHKEYDTDNLIDTKNKLENQKKWSFSFIILLLIISAILIFFVWRSKQNEKKIKLQYKNLEIKLMSENSKFSNVNESCNNKISFNKSIYDDILKKLNAFEEKKQFREKGLTIMKLAKKFDTNSSYLSQVINETKNMGFNKYISELRIKYITELLYFDKKYLNYTVESLAEECGMASRQNFSDLFFQINKIRPKDFIKQRQIDLKGK